HQAHDGGFLAEVEVAVAADLGLGVSPCGPFLEPPDQQHLAVIGQQLFPVLGRTALRALARTTRGRHSRSPLSCAETLRSGPAVTGLQMKRYRFILGKHRSGSPWQPTRFGGHRREAARETRIALLGAMRSWSRPCASS